MTELPISLDIPIVTEIYKDVASPVAKQAGVTLGEVAELILTPIYRPTKFLNSRIKKWFSRLENEVPKEELMEASPNITIPTIQNLAMQQDETILGEMFYNILKSSMNKTKQKFLSPAFPRLLEQLTRDEAVMIMLLKEKKYKVEIDDLFNAQEQKFYDHKELLNEFPVEYLEFADNLWLYSDHLNHLNLAGCWQYKSPEPIYSDKVIEKGTGAIKYQEKEQIASRTFSEFRLTDFGQAFAEVCVSSKCKNLL